MHSQIIQQDYSKKKEFWYFFASDIHFGNKGQDLKLLKYEFDKAKERNARIFINGDVFDLILSGDRKRYTPSGDKYGTDNNVNLAIDEAYEFLSPYVKQIDMIGCGNHETAVQKHHQIDVTQQLIWSLNKTHGTKICHGQYSGYLILRYHHGDNQSVKTKKIFYNHGQGGASEVTKGTIGLNRHFNNKICDVLWLGHSHTKVLLPSEWILDVNQNGDIIQRERAGIITGCYLKVATQYNAQKEGYILNYGEERMRGLQGTGGIFMRHDIVGNEIRQTFEI
jgi:predicted phosphodiesterase